MLEQQQVVVARPRSASALLERERLVVGDQPEPADAQHRSGTRSELGGPVAARPSSSATRARNDDDVGAVDGPVVPAQPEDPVEWMAIDSDPSAWVDDHRPAFMPSVARIATCGWLMIGTVKKVPKGPSLVMENVPPAMSSALSWLRPRPVGEIADPAGHARAA